MASNFLRGNTPVPGQPITSKSFGNISEAATAARNAPRTDVFGIQAAGGFIAFPGANRASPSPAVGSYPWRLYNTTTGSTGQVQVNGGDGQVAQLNGTVCEIGFDGGPPSDTLLPGPPPAYPQLAVTGNGFIIAYCQPTTPGLASPLTQLYLYWASTFPAQDTNLPATFYYLPVGTISNYTTDGSGNVSFDLNNVYGSGYGPSTLVYCGNPISVY